MDQPIAIFLDIWFSLPHLSYLCTVMDNCGFAFLSSSLHSSSNIPYFYSGDLPFPFSGTAQVSWLSLASWRTKDPNLAYQMLFPWSSNLKKFEKRLNKSVIHFFLKEYPQRKFLLITVIEIN